VGMEEAEEVRAAAKQQESNQTFVLLLQYSTPVSSIHELLSHLDRASIKLLQALSHCESLSDKLTKVSVPR